MKKMRRFAGLLLAMVMVMSMAVSVFAAGTHTIKIQNTKDGHTYEAYQIFKGDVLVETVGEGEKAETTKILSNVKWGASTNSTGNVAESILKDLSLETAISYVDFTKGAVATSTDKGDYYEISNLEPGYYLVKDADGSLVNNKEDAYTNYIIQVVGDVDMDPKSDVPSLEKKILADGNPNNKAEANRVDANNASVGDTVTYLLETAVPDMTGYTKYIFRISDTMSEGLTYNEDSLIVKVDGMALTKGEEEGEGDYTVSVSAGKNDENGGKSFTITFNDFYDKYKNQVDDVIQVTFTATINKYAMIGNEGNPNGAHLEYSNNPNYTDDTPDDDTDDVVGKTPEDYVITYITGIDLFKVDDANNRLSGATFKLVGNTLNRVKVYGQRFVEPTAETMEQAKYYKLKDGSYTTKEPNDETLEKYEDTTKKYVLEEFEQWVTAPSTKEIVATVDNQGFVRFEGLEEGLYTIYEIVTPEGYNTIPNPIQVRIEWKGPDSVVDGEETAKWSYKYTTDGSEPGYTTEAEWEGINIDKLAINIVNKRGTVLPETGGMGTTLFYVIGATLAIGAAVVMVTRRRMSAN